MTFELCEVSQSLFKFNSSLYLRFSRIAIALLICLTIYLIMEQLYSLEERVQIAFTIMKSLKTNRHAYLMCRIQIDSDMHWMMFKTRV